MLLSISVVLWHQEIIHFKLQTSRMENENGSSNNNVLPPIKEEHFKFYDFFVNASNDEGFNAIIAGSSVLAMSLQQHQSKITFKPNDVDIFSDYRPMSFSALEGLLELFHLRHNIEAKITKCRMNQEEFSYTGNANYKINAVVDIELLKTTITTDPSRNDISRFSSVTETTTPNVQLIFVSSRETPNERMSSHDFSEMILGSFDLTICQVAYVRNSNKNNIHYFSQGVQADIHSGQMRLNLFNRTNLHTLPSRLKKYMTRGFSLTAIHMLQRCNLHILGPCLLVEHERNDGSVMVEPESSISTSADLTDSIESEEEHSQDRQ